MNTHDIDIEMPPLPTPDADHYDNGTFAPVWRKSKMEVYGKQCYQAGVEADRKRKGEVVVTKTPEGEIVAVTRQDDEGKILSVIAEADRKRRSEPVAWIRKNGFRFISEIEPQDDSEVPLYATPQPDEPEKQETMTARELADRVSRGEKWKIADPVKVPSDGDIEDLVKGIASEMFGEDDTPYEQCDREFYGSLARALLTRYG